MWIAYSKGLTIPIAIDEKRGFHSITGSGCTGAAGVTTEDILPLSSATFVLGNTPRRWRFTYPISEGTDRS